MCHMENVLSKRSHLMTCTHHDGDVSGYWCTWLGFVNCLVQFLICDLYQRMCVCDSDSCNGVEVCRSIPTPISLQPSFLR